MVADRERESQVSLLARRGFGNPRAAAALLTSELFGELGRDPLVLDAISRSADPDLALATVGRLLEASPDPWTLRATLAASKPLRDRLFGVLAVSGTLGDFVVRHPESWHVLEEFEPEDLAPDPDRFRALMFDAVGVAPAGAAGPPVAAVTGLAAQDALRVAYRRALLAITARDVAASADLSVVTADLADLAGATLSAALAVAAAEDPASAALCRLAVIGMGKCGARELNYVSDVDVVFVAEPVRSEGGGAAVDDAEALRAASRLASRMMRLCSDSTAEGSIWQVDAGLRPEGKSGPLVRTLASHAAYYQRWAKTWEFQALLKARPVAGDEELGAAYIAMTSPLVWSAASHEHFVDDVQAMRRRVVDHATDSLRRAPGSIAVDRELKLGPGGLRDVEFAVQLLQLVHGRRDETLRVSATLDALEALADGGYVGREDGAHLADAYRFLRTLEHRIQLFRLERTHTMPDDPVALRRIGRSMGWMMDPAGELGKAWRGHAREVRRLHEKLFYRPLLAAVARLDDTSAAAVPSGSGPALRLSGNEARARLSALGYADPAGALANIEALATGVSRRAAIQRTLLPVMLGWFADAPDPDAGLLAFRRVSDALGSTPWYLRSLRDEGEAAWRLARVLSCGGYVPDLLLRDPGAVALLGDTNALVPRDRAAIEAEMMAVVLRATSSEQAVTAVRAIRRRELFRIVSADLLGLLGTAGRENGHGRGHSLPGVQSAGARGADNQGSGIQGPGIEGSDIRSAGVEGSTVGSRVASGVGGGIRDGQAGGAGNDPLDELGRALTDVTAATIEAALAAVIVFRTSGRPADIASRVSEQRVDAEAGASASADPDAEVGARTSADVEVEASASAGVSVDVSADVSVTGGRPLPTRLAVIAMGRFGGGELGYGSDADVIFVHEPVDGADEHEATALAFELANELRRLLQAPGTDPPLLIDADLRPEGRQGPLVRSLAAYAEYYKRWSRLWESQALLRATPIAGDAGVGARFTELIDPIRYPEKGLSEADALEIRRIKARVEAERLPRGADRALHTKLGPGGLSDVEWVAQLLQLRHAAQVPALRVTGTRAALGAAVDAGLMVEGDRSLLDDAWCQTTRMRNGITLARGRPADQIPTGARDLAVIARYLEGWDHAGETPGEGGVGAGAGGSAGSGALDRHHLDNEALLDAHRRRARRARIVFERLFYG
ncbi:MAG TPA: bifunctional [glutamine synthetase] adenylyltransferase/[glutamine synthetase]-adenylyl-L-tyrosine phosphorylase [Actinocrinis sp.]|nr:bifunctional [glutamine synthetase] adenylyltransferase/[glutamine synthetase]-adenylyl-L-tyrosine phosphorylase [Actinocrinis sp.]HEV2342450.1 bifunctional [glutamine synthetase] adenylyltransferase/[glutamine synthetase]-adenylyl-L-tyrosine phosphorylase [Actinocrinis sp.]